MLPERRDRRYASMDIRQEGNAHWHEHAVRSDDAHNVKTRFSAFIQGTSDLETHLRGRGIDTVRVGGTATHVCCESTARDAMMLNFKTVMVADVLATYDDETQNASLSAFYSNFGDVQTADEAIASLKRGLAQAAA